MNADNENQVTQPQRHQGGRGASFAIWMGPIIVFVGAVTYFVVFARYPALRDFPWVNLPLVILGFVISMRGLQHAYADKNSGIFVKIFASLGAVVSSALTVLFCAYLFYLSYQLPSTENIVHTGQPAPDFSLEDQRGEEVRLSDYRGKLVVLDFYRGHW